MYESRLKSEELDKLFETVLSLESVEECYRFFEDLCTIGELRDMGQRWEVARLLDIGVTYSAVAEKTNTSTATISRVNKCISYGADGYRLALDKMKEKTDGDMLPPSVDK